MGKKTGREINSMIIFLVLTRHVVVVAYGTALPFLHEPASTRSHYYVGAAIGVNNFTDFPNLQTECDIFKRFLHLTSAKGTYKEHMARVIVMVMLYNIVKGLTSFKEHVILVVTESWMSQRS